MNEFNNEELDLEQELENEKKKEKKEKTNKIIKILLILLLLQFLGMGLYGMSVKGLFKKNETIHDDYIFNTGNVVQVKDDNLSVGKEVGLSVRVIHYLDKDGTLDITIKNTGSLNTKPRILFKDKVIYTGPSLKPKQAVTANVKFGKLKEGEYTFNVIGNKNEEDINSTGVMLECILRVEKQIES